MAVRARVLASSERGSTHVQLGRPTTRDEVLAAEATAFWPPRLAVVIEGSAFVDALVEKLRSADVSYHRFRDKVLIRSEGVSPSVRDALASADLDALDALDRAVRAWTGGAPDLALAGGTRLRLSKRAHLMGIVNVTPDSFSDGGRFLDAEAAVKHGLRLVDEGADVLDVGGESTRPGADPVPADEEIARVVPVIEGIRARSDVPISIDTMKATVARAALDAGASIVNDVSAGRFDPEMFAVCAEREVPVVLMHMLGEPRTMQKDPRYDDVVGDIYTFLAERADAAIAAGVRRDRIAIDPGFGFGKTREHNLTLLHRLREFTCLGYPVLVGTSRKSFIGTTLDLPVEERLEGTAATVALSVINGAAIVRVHDVGPMRRVAGMVEAVIGTAGGGTG